MSDIFDDLRAKKARLYEELSKQPSTEIIGVVGADGAGGSRLRGEELWTLQFTLSSWRNSEGELMTTELTIQSQVTEEELNQFRERISPFQIIRSLVRIGSIGSAESRQAVLLDLIDSEASDDDLQETADSLRKPLTISTKQFGTLTLNRKLGWYEGKARAGFRKIEISLEPDDLDSTHLVIELGGRLWKDIRDWDFRARERACEELLSVKNESWLEENERPVTAQAFKKRMKLESVTVLEGRGFEFWYGDGDLFWGHSIEVRGDFGSGFTSAAFHG